MTKFCVIIGAAGMYQGMNETFEKKESNIEKNSKDK